jgi:hypothetical protein
MWKVIRVLKGQPQPKEYNETGALPKKTKKNKKKPWEKKLRVKLHR